MPKIIASTVKSLFIRAIAAVVVCWSAARTRIQQDRLGTSIWMYLFLFLPCIATFLACVAAIDPGPRYIGYGKAAPVDMVVKEGRAYKIVTAYAVQDLETLEEWYVGYPFDSYPRDKAFTVSNGHVYER